MWEETKKKTEEKIVEFCILFGLDGEKGERKIEFSFHLFT